MAAVYNVPLGGALFALEVLLGTLALPLVLPALLTSLLATAVAWIVVPTHATYALPTYGVSGAELVWAALMVIAAGLGPFAGTLALALHTTGVLGRLYAESLENLAELPERALRETGSGRISAFAYATLPLVTAQGVAYALYRLEMNIRMAAVLGFVGAGGLGQLLYFHLSLFQEAQSATLLIAMLLLVFAVDTLSAAIRARLAPAHG